MISELNKVFQQETANSSRQSIDECMVNFKGRSSLKQYMPKKPIKRGFKVWGRCDAVTGYLYAFQVYTGKGENCEDEGLGFNVVMTLSSNLPHNTLLAFDNFFTGCNLMEALYERKIFAVGTVRTNRKDLPDILKKSQPKNLRLQKNQFAAITAEPITAIKWLDMKDVTILTTAHHPIDTQLVKRTQKDGTKKEVLCPKAIASYTLTMGGVDHFDHFRSSYPINRKCRKFWMGLFFFMFDASIINSYITYNTVHVVNTHSHREFRLSFLADIFQKLNGLNLSLQVKQTTVFQTYNKTTAFTRKLDFWIICVGKRETESFTSLSEFVSDNDSEMFQDDVFGELVQYLTWMRASFEKYFPDEQNTKMKFNSWIHNPFLPNLQMPESISNEIYESPLEMSSNTSMESLFKTTPLDDFWCRIRDEYPLLGKMTLNIFLPFPTTYLCEIGFSTYAATKTKYRNRLDAEPDMRLQLSSIKPDINQLIKNKKQFYTSL
ncbi:Zinc finger BED domain-containing protein 5 [Eumeta japonica]|uniref:Zinc finger BED domain-containing protein 5 n=1 Tax=Eumeta variegata TaxID=151549 RepID=A0A4C1YSH5_EUMVA|nr:Zinc finger BED domain-containing protein 5 [Eumeta japonica]